MRILNQRVHDSGIQTLGRFHLLRDDNSIIYTWDSLELPDKNNQVRVSRIPAGKYKALVHYSPKFGKCLWLQDVEGRTEILVHKGNFYYDILGCILIGSNLKYINNDEYLDVTSSGASMRKLMGYIGKRKEIEIEIVDEI